MFSGQSRRDHTAMVYFGQFPLWPIPTLANSYFGQFLLWPGLIVIIKIIIINIIVITNLIIIAIKITIVIIRIRKIMIFITIMIIIRCRTPPWTALSRTALPRTALPPGHSSPGHSSTGPPSPGPPLHRTPPSTGPPSGPLCRTAQNFALFSLSRHNFHSFFSLLGVLSWNFGGVFEGWDPQMCMFELSGCRGKFRRLRGRGFTRQPENSKRAHFQALALQKHHPRERRKNEHCGERVNKKRKILGPPPFGPTLRGQLFLGLGPRRGPTLRVPNPSEEPTLLGLHSWGAQPFGVIIVIFTYHLQLATTIIKNLNHNHNYNKNDDYNYQKN